MESAFGKASRISNFTKGSFADFASTAQGILAN